MPVLYDRRKAYATGATDDDINRYIAEQKAKGVDIQEVNSQEPQKPKNEDQLKEFIINSLPVIGGIGGTVLAGPVGGAALSGIGSVAKNLLDNKEGFDVGEVLLDTALGGVGGIGAKGISTVGKQVVKGATEKLPERLMGSVFKESVKDSKAAVAGAKSLGKEALERGQWGTTEKLFRNSNTQLENAENALQGILTASDKTIPFKDIRKMVSPVIDEFRQAGKTETVNALEKRLTSILGEVGENVPVSRANEIKRTLYKEINDAYGKESTPTREGLKQIARGFKEGIENAHDGALKDQIKQINKDLGYWGRHRESIIDKMSRDERNQLIGLSDLPLVAGGMIPGAAPAAVAGYAAKKALGSTIGKTGTAQVLKKAGELTQLPAIQTAGKIGAATGGQVLAQGGGLVGKQTSNDSVSDQSNNQDFQNNLPPITDSTTDSSQMQQTGSNGIYSPEEFAQAYMNAYKAGDVKSANAIKNAYDDLYGEKGFMNAGNQKPKKYSEGDKKFLLAKNEAQKALSILGEGNVSTGKVAAVGSKVAEFLGTQDPNTTAFKAQLSTARTAARNALLGANMSDKEMESYLDAIFSYSNEPAIIKAKLETFINSLQDYENSIAGTGTGIEDLVGGQLPPIQ